MWRASGSRPSPTGRIDVIVTPPIPVSRELVPAGAPVAPDGFNVVTTGLQGGLPHVVPFEGDFSALLVVPSGVAAIWRDTDVTDIVGSSDAEVIGTARMAEEVGLVGRPAARVLLRAGGEVRASMPLAAGVRRRRPDSGEPDQGTGAEVIVIGWQLCAGSLRGPGDFGSRIQLAWRRIDRGTDRFSPPVINPHLRARLEATSRLESDPYTAEPAERRRLARGRKGIPWRSP